MDIATLNTNLHKLNGDTNIYIPKGIALTELDMRPVSAEYYKNGTRATASSNSEVIVSEYTESNIKRRAVLMRYDGSGIFKPATPEQLEASIKAEEESRMITVLQTTIKTAEINWGPSVPLTGNGKSRNKADGIDEILAAINTINFGTNHSTNKNLLFQALSPSLDQDPSKLAQSKQSIFALYDALVQIKDYLTRNPDVTIQIHGYSDNSTYKGKTQKDSDALNKQLSERRAHVLEELARVMGITQFDSTPIVGHGSDGSNTRRCEIVFSQKRGSETVILGSAPAPDFYEEYAFLDVADSGSTTTDGKVKTRFGHIQADGTISWDPFQEIYDPAMEYDAVHGGYGTNIGLGGWQLLAANTPPKSNQRITNAGSLDDGYVSISTTTDNGNTWSKPVRTHSPTLEENIRNGEYNEDGTPKVANTKQASYQAVTDLEEIDASYLQTRLNGLSNDLLPAWFGADGQFVQADLKASGTNTGRIEALVFAVQATIQSIATPGADIPTLQETARQQREQLSAALADLGAAREYVDNYLDGNGSFYTDLSPAEKKKADQLRVNTQANAIKQRIDSAIEALEALQKPLTEAELALNETQTPSTTITSASLVHAKTTYINDPLVLSITLNAIPKDKTDVTIDVIVGEHLKSFAIPNNATNGVPFEITVFTQGEAKNKANVVNATGAPSPVEISIRLWDEKTNSGEGAYFGDITTLQQKVTIKAQGNGGGNDKDEDDKKPASAFNNNKAGCNKAGYTFTGPNSTTGTCK